MRLTPLTMAVPMLIAIAVVKSANFAILADPHQRRRPRSRPDLQPFMEGLKAAKVALDRKVLADIAATDAVAFGEIVNIAKNALKNKPAATLAKA